MIRKSHLLLALALVAAAVAAPIAQSNSTPKVDPLAVSYLIGQGLTPSEVMSWTTGACSHRVKAVSCDTMFRPAAASANGLPAPMQRRGTGDVSARAAAPKVDPLAVSYLTGQGLSPSQVTSWTTGACSHQIKAASCYAMFKPAATSSAATSATKVTGSTGFQWRDAGIGAGFTLGIVLLLGAASAGLLISRRNGRQQTARAA